MRSPNLPANHNLRRNLLGSGVAFLGAAGLLGGNADPAQADLSLGALGPNQTLQGAETSGIPKSVERIMRLDTAYMTSLGCSGSVIRNEKGVAGAFTADHCVDGERILGSDGEYYIVQPKQVKVRIGADKDKLKTVAAVDKFIVPMVGDIQHDFALAVAEDHTPKEALKSYLDTTASPQDLQQLKIGDTVYNASWPVYQPNNAHGRMERQSFKARFVGLGKANNGEGKSSMDVAWLAFPKTKDGSSSTPGASGSVSFIMKHGKMLKIGPMSTFFDMSGTFTGKEPNGTQPNTLATKDNATELASASYTAPVLSGPGRNAMILHSVRSAKEIPGYTDPKEIYKQVVETLSDPNKPKAFINGAISYPLQKGGGNEVGQVITDNPVVIHNEQLKITMFISAVEDVAGHRPDLQYHLDVTYFNDSDLGKVTVYSNNADPAALGPVPLSGALQYEASETNSNGDLTDQQQQKVGIKNPDLASINGEQAFSISTGNGSFSFQAYRAMK